MDLDRQIRPSRADGRNTFLQRIETGNSGRRSSAQPLFRLASEVTTDYSVCSRMASVMQIDLGGLGAPSR
jgi:hypothetical protein